MTEQELNEAVARKLKGWTSNCKCEFPVEYAHHNCPAEFANCHHAGNCNLPAYSTSIEAAWEILEKMTDWTMGTSSDPTDPKFYCCVSREDRLAVIGKADDIPRAICEAFLKLP